MEIQVGGGSLALEIRVGGGVTVIQEIRVGGGVKKSCHPSGGGGGGVDFFWNNSIYSLKIAVEASEQQDGRNLLHFRSKYEMGTLTV